MLRKLNFKTYQFIKVVNGASHSRKTVNIIRPVLHQSEKLSNADPCVNHSPKIFFFDLDPVSQDSQPSFICATHMFYHHVGRPLRSDLHLILQGW